MAAEIKGPHRRTRAFAMVAEIKRSIGTAPPQWLPKSGPWQWLPKSNAASPHRHATPRWLPKSNAASPRRYATMVAEIKRSIAVTAPAAMVAGIKCQTCVRRTRRSRWLRPLKSKQRRRIVPSQAITAGSRQRTFDFGDHRRARGGRFDFDFGNHRGVCRVF